MAKKKRMGSPRLIHSANDTGRDFIKGNFIDVTKDYGETFHKLGYGRMFKNFGLGNDDLVTMSDEFGYGLLHGLSKEESLLNGLNKVRGYWQDRVDEKSLSGVGFSKDQKAEAQRLLNVTKGTYINYSEKADRVKAKRERYNQLKEKYRISPTQDDRIKENKWLLKSSKKSLDRHRQKRAPGKNSRRGRKYTYAMERAGEEKRAAHAASQRKAALKANAGAKRWRSVKGKFGKIVGAITSLLGRSGTKKEVEKVLSYPAGGKYSKAKILSGSRLEEEGVHRTSLSRDLDIREKQRKTEGSYNKASQDDFTAWLEGNKRVYGQNEESYSGLRTGEMFNPSVSKSIDRHLAKKNGVRRKGDRYDIVQAAHTPAGFRDFEAERLERLRKSQEAIQERQGVKIDSPSIPPKSGEPVRQEAAQVEPTNKTGVGEQPDAPVEKVAAPAEPAAESVEKPAAPDAPAPEPVKPEETEQGPIAAQAKEPSGKPTDNQKAAGASSGSGDDSYDAKLKALRKKGRANEYAADRIEQEKKEVIDMINAGNYKDAAGALGYTGEYTAEHADKLRQAAEKHAMDAVNEGAGIMDYVNAYHVPGAIGGAAILAGTGVALMSDNGRKSNEQLYSSPF